MITIPFEKTDGIYVLRDSITLTLEEYAEITEAQLEAIKQTRFDNWVSFMSIPSVTDEVE